MSRNNFNAWLCNEVTAVKCLLLALYEHRDELRYIVAPRLEAEYMMKIGAQEELVVKEEIETELLREKQRKIQICINRNESVDEEKIDEELDVERKKLYKEAEQSGTGVTGSFDEAKQQQLSDIYHEIVQNFHPATHPDLPEAHKKLFEQAQDSYRNQDVEALELIYALLEPQEDTIEIDPQLLKDMLKIAQENVKEDEEQEKKQKLLTDYTLSEAIFPCFQKTNEEAILYDKKQEYDAQSKIVQTEIDDLLQSFPFNAEETLRNEEKLESYKSKLNVRSYTARVEQECLQKEIDKMLKRCRE